MVIEFVGTLEDVYNKLTLGGSSAENDFIDATTIAVINKRAGGVGLITRRNASQLLMKE